MPKGIIALSESLRSSGAFMSPGEKEIHRTQKIKNKNRVHGGAG